jgi:hypothetical protein
MSNTIAPIQVYLDSSAFSDFADSKKLKSSPYLKDVLNFLIACQQKRIIDVRFSLLHIAEISPLKEEFIQVALQRAKVLKKLCREKCFLPFEKVILVECKNLITAQEEGRSLSPFQNNGVWCHQEWFSSFGDFEEIKGLQKFAISCTNKFKFRTVLEESISKDMYAPFFNLQNIYKFAFDKIAWENIVDDLVTNFSDVEKFIANFLYKEPDNNITQYIRKIGQNFAKILQQGQSELQQLEIPLTENGTFDADGEIKKALLKQSWNVKTLELRNLLLMNFYMLHLKWDALYRVDKELLEKHAMRAPLGNLPSIGLLASLIRQFQLEKTINYNEKVTDSDAIDLLHCCYLPYCDVFHADKRTVELLKKIKGCIDYTDRTVQNLKIIPQKIRDIATQRGIAIKF